MNSLWNAIARGTLTDAQLGRLDAYLDRLIEINQQINLTRITDRLEAEIKHVADALTLLEFLPPPLSFPPPPEGGGRGRGSSGRSQQIARMTPIAKKLRREMTRPEKRIWARLRSKRADLKFRRQQPIGPYVVDFYCHAARLVIELESLSHETAAEADMQRQTWLESEGYCVIRFTSDDALRTPDAVVETILHACTDRHACADDGRRLDLDPRHPSPQPPPSRGGGEDRRLSLADVGTGGGIPGVVLAIARPDLDVTLIDATRKKLDAVAAICADVGVGNVRTLHARIEDIKLTFDVVTARGVADLNTLVGWCRGLLGRDGVLLAMKGPKAEQEIEAARRTLGLARLRARFHPVDAAGLVGHVIVDVRQG